jgi:hypothetical protein
MILSGTSTLGLPSQTEWGPLENPIDDEGTPYLPINITSTGALTTAPVGVAALTSPTAVKTLPAVGSNAALLQRYAAKILASIASVQTYAQQVLADAPVGWWRLNEVANTDAVVDAVGNQNGVYTNTAGVTVQQAGITGGEGTATKFASASTSYVAIADNAAQHVGNTFTIEAWVKLTSPGTANYGIFSGVASKPGMFIDSTGAIQVARAGVSVICVSTATITDTAFHHVVWTKNGATTTLYLDGVNVTGVVTDFTFANATTLVIGGYSATPSFPMNGTIDEVALYPTALSAARVLAHYNAGINRSVSLVRAPAPVESVTATGTSTLVRSPARILSVTGTGIASLVRSLNKTLSITAVGVSSYIRAPSSLLTVVGSSTASFVRSIERVLTTIGTGVASKLSGPAPTFTATHGASVASLIRAPGRIFSYAATGTATLKRTVKEIKSVVITTVLTLIRDAAKLLVAESPNYQGIDGVIFGGVVSAAPNITYPTMISASRCRSRLNDITGEVYDLSLVPSVGDATFDRLDVVYVFSPAPWIPEPDSKPSPPGYDMERVEGVPSASPVLPGMVGHPTYPYQQTGYNGIYYFAALYSYRVPAGATSSNDFTDWTDRRLMVDAYKAGIFSVPKLVHSPSRILSTVGTGLAIFSRVVPAALLATSTGIASLLKRVPSSIIAIGEGIASLIRAPEKTLRPERINWIWNSDANTDDNGWFHTFSDSTITREITDFVNGNACIKATLNASSGSASFRLYSTDDVGYFNDGEELTFSCYVKSSVNGATLRLYTRMTDPFGFTDHSTGGISTSDTSWTRLSFTFTADQPGSPQQLDLAVLLSSGLSTGDYFLVAGAQLERGNTLTDQIVTDGTYVSVGTVSQLVQVNSEPQINLLAQAVNSAVIEFTRILSAFLTAIGSGIASVTPHLIISRTLAAISQGVAVIKRAPSLILRTTTTGFLLDEAGNKILLEDGSGYMLQSTPGSPGLASVTTELVISIIEVTLTAIGTGAAALVRAPAHNLVRACTATARLIKQPQRTLTTMGSDVATLIKTPKIVRQVTGTGTAYLQRVSNKTLRGTISGVVTLRRSPSRILITARTAVASFTVGRFATLSSSATGVTTFLASVRIVLSTVVNTVTTLFTNVVHYTLLYLLEGYMHVRYVATMSTHYTAEHWNAWSRKFNVFKTFYVREWWRKWKG